MAQERNMSIIGLASGTRRSTFEVGPRQTKPAYAPEPAAVLAHGNSSVGRANAPRDASRADGVPAPRRCNLCHPRRIKRAITIPGKPLVPQHPVVALMASFALLTAASAFGQTTPVQVMVVGTYHMDNPGQDLVNVRAADVLTSQRQAELAAVAEALAKFKPTVVAIERITAAPGYVDDNYSRFKEADLAGQRDERVQIGYRVARSAGLGIVHGIDEQPTAGEPDYFPFEKVQASAHARGQDAALAALLEQAGSMVSKFGDSQEKKSVAELLRTANDEHGLANPSLYYALLGLDAGEDQPGAELLGYWYMRNAKIVAKLCDVVKPGDRVLVLFGAGHKHWLEQIAHGVPGFQVVDAAQYLPAK
jgi:hypothetical protein